MDLSEDDVLEILKLFEHSKFDFLDLQHGERRITLAKGGYGGPAVAPLPSPVGSAPVAAPLVAVPPVAVPPGAAPVAGAPAAIPPGLVAVPAPMVGKFYAAPSPADPPYVQAGTAVTVGATIGLIEVMKVFTSIKAEAAGTIEQILVRNGEFVEFGQALFLLRPDPADKG